jgi:hypothetical protein
VRAGLAVLAIAVAGCADFPRDPERTEALVRESKALRLGWVANAAPEPQALEVLARIEKAAGARIQSKQADSETLLRELEEGKIDLVFGSFAMDSPWAKHVHLGKAIGWRAEPPKHVAAPRFAYRSGENGWIMRVERAARESTER